MLLAIWLVYPPAWNLKDFKFDLQRFADLTLSTDGSGNYLITSKDDLQNLANFVNGGGDTSGLTFKLTANISGVDFHIGDTDAHKFKGTVDGTHGGFVAVNNDRIKFKNSIFNGSLLGENTDSCGGFIGYNKSVANVGYTNIFAPTAVTISGNNSATISRGSGAGTRNCCYTQAFGGTGAGTRAYKLNAPLPEGVTTSDALTFGDTTYLKTSGTLKYNGKSYNYSVNQDTTITLEDGKLFVNDTELKLAFLDTLDKDSDGYYLIGTLEQLRGFATYANQQAAKADYLQGKKFKLSADITLPDVAEGESNRTMLPGFRGEFNGDNHTIANMTIYTTGGAKGGLFGSVSSVGKVHKLNLTDVNISGNFGYCGGIAVYNYGTIRYCFADVQISDVDCAGAIVGGQTNDGKIYLTSYHSDRNINGGGNSGAGYVEDSVKKLYRLNLPEGVTASGYGVEEHFGKYYFSSIGATVTLSEPVGDITTFTTSA